MNYQKVKLRKQARPATTVGMKIRSFQPSDDGDGDGDSPSWLFEDIRFSVCNWF